MTHRLTREQRFFQTVKLIGRMKAILRKQEEFKNKSEEELDEEATKQALPNQMERLNFQAMRTQVRRRISGKK